MTDDSIKIEAAAHDWWHQIHLGYGIVTPGACNHGQTEAELSGRWALPDDLANKSVMDIGCWDGLFSVACLRRGAFWVEGVDVVDRPTFVLARKALGYSSHQMRFRKWDAQKPLYTARRELVLCFGVLYHVERPLEVLRNAVRLATETVIIETALAAQVGGGDEGVRWVQARGHADDPTNIWFPTAGAVLDALRVFGCREARQHFLLPGGSRGTFVGTK